jgi:hypothetical protein
MDFSIAEMHCKGFIDREEAVMRSSNPTKMDKQLSPAGRLEAANAEK